MAGLCLVDCFGFSVMTKSWSATDELLTLAKYRQGNSLWTVVCKYVSIHSTLNLLLKWKMRSLHKFLYSFNVITLVCPQKASSIVQKVLPIMFLKLCWVELSTEQLMVASSSHLCPSHSFWVLWPVTSCSLLPSFHFSHERGKLAFTCCAGHCGDGQQTAQSSARVALVWNPPWSQLWLCYVMPE